VSSTWRALAGVVTLALCACGGGGSASVAPGGGSHGTGGGTGPTAQTTITITIPLDEGGSSNGTRGAQSVRPTYVSTNTNSMTITVGGNALQGSPYNLAPASNLCTGTGTETCTIQVPAPVGTNETWVIDIYESSNGTGTPLALDSASETVTQGQLNTIDFTLNPVVNAYSVAWSSLDTGDAICNTYSGGAPVFTPGSDTGQCGVLAVTAEDASGATIISPGSYYTASGSAVTLSVSDNLPGVAPWSSEGYFFVYPLGGSTCNAPCQLTAPQSSAPSNLVEVRYQGVSSPSTTFDVNDNGSIESTNSIDATLPQFAGTPSLTVSCAITYNAGNSSNDTCSNWVAPSTLATLDFTQAGDTGAVALAEPGWTNAPYSQSFTLSTANNSCSSSVVTYAAPVFTAGTTAGGASPDTCEFDWTDSTHLNQTVKLDVYNTLTDVTIDSAHRSR
jgi:hypothetical protein